jgi:hypothetical protein
MNFTEFIILLTDAILDPVGAALFGLFSAMFSLPGVSLGGLLRGLLSFFL